MFHEWVARGAQIGIEAFFALVVFLAFCAAVFGLAMLGGKGVGNDDTNRRVRKHGHDDDD